MATATEYKHPNLTYFLKVIVPVIVTAVTVSLGLVFWVQTYAEDHSYDKERGEILESQVAEVKTDLRTIREQNLEILQAIGRLQGQLDR